MSYALVRQRVKDVAALAEKQAKFTMERLHGSGRDLLTMMVEERETFKGTENELTEVEMVDQVLTFLAAGHETTAGTVTWATYVLATRPDVQEKLRAEITELVGKTPGAPPSWTDIDALPYLNNFTKEVTRLYSAGI